MKKAAIILFMLAAGLLQSAGCSGDPSQGYTMKSPYPQNVKTVAVPIFTRGKDVYRRELEFRLTEAVQKQIQLNTNYHVVDRSRADTLLVGSIDTISERVLSFNPDTGDPRDKEITMVVSFTWTDLRTGKVLATRTKLPLTSTYIPPTPFNENFFEGSEDVMIRIASRIVEQMEAPWGK